VNDETPLAVPRLSGLDYVAIRWQLSAVRREVVDRRLHRVEHEHGRPAMMMDGLLVVRLEGNLKNPEPVILEQNLVVARGGNHSIQCWIPD
jgi:hypothetical protein